MPVSVHNKKYINIVILCGLTLSWFWAVRLIMWVMSRYVTQHFAPLKRLCVTTKITAVIQQGRRRSCSSLETQ